MCKVTIGNRSGKALHSRPHCQYKPVMSVLAISLHILWTNWQFAWNIGWTLRQWTMPQSHVTSVSHGRCLNVLSVKNSILKLCILVTHTHFHYISIKAIIDHWSYKYIWNTGYETTYNLYVRHSYRVATARNVKLWGYIRQSYCGQNLYFGSKCFQRENNTLHATKQIPEYLCSSHLLINWIL